MSDNFIYEMAIDHANDLGCLTEDEYYAAVEDYVNEYFYNKGV